MAVLPPGSTTLLVLSTPMGVPLFSARGLKQSLTVIRQAQQLRRTINGELVDLSLSQFRKYASTISCTDQRAPAIDGIWPGQILTVSCVAELSYLTAGGSPARTVVSGSSYTEGDFTFYRPQLTMRVVTPQTEMDEWKASVGWSLQLEEI
jgi:hypothetical protein